MLGRCERSVPMTAKMRVLVKCLYSESFTTFLLSRSSFIVWARLMKMWLTVKESRTFSLKGNVFTFYL